jgi:hypothetical protein
MEERTNTNLETEKDSKSFKRKLRLYQWASILMLLIIGLLTYMLIMTRQSLETTSTKVELTLEENLELQAELDSLLNEYTYVKHEYDSVLLDKDIKILEKAKEIEQLIAQQADYWRIRRQLNMLREITQNYVREIDSLHVENKVLKDENVRMQDVIHKAVRQTEELSQSKLALEEKVEMAATLRAFQINATAVRLAGFRKNERETDSAKKTEKIKVCFIVAENPITPAGIKNIYLRIAGPDSEILRFSDDDLYSFSFQGETLQFSTKSSIDYQNSNIEMCLYWEKTHDFVPGQYVISIFTNDALMGETYLTLN